MGSRSNSPSKPNLNQKFKIDSNLKEVIPIEKEVKQKYAGFADSFE
jgi:hypothetical protein